ncbi:HEAT repeat domain-containing protein [Bradyrhizobium sp. AUGA SZCCT0283]|uniref:HEAT repeat domain-containing protein n=1 Tax=Bradyrhizobium sp. AUGA SZCCT0283 TaxID=2807671 RepID=UPI001BACA79B|nr:HEAT repeat domain-containing protein [Bradyrhizobium sp. AUGA SZCCT0283]MBR1278533.1 HEAT repeat domain-containing protein [Bradyrhizobium sp. AUGA SZCCT0283]
MREDAATLEILASVAGVDDQFLRRTALDVIRRHRHGRELSAVVLSALGDPSEYVVRTACEVVEQWRLLEAHNLLLPLLANVDAATRQSAIRALGAIWVDADFPLVFRIYEEDFSTDVRREAAWVLRQHVTAACSRTLFDAFSADELARHRLWACEFAENFSGPEILPLLSRLCSDPDGHVRKAAGRATKVIASR